ncbi:histidine phosphatase family protein [Actinocrinis puniceicyclus]|uniref:Histidine phosphatase family protein n=1 Tax=Actinocrinis puniceicyclus TaxID=977794 RepID=A0A8J8BCH7_9ACTN|nr:histidine phosphatase family protein [Actinocrinis puniceicyclus]MBS2963535.1 histidine phosphatase family protein [Actinocrinis puniceicyclus]
MTEPVTTRHLLIMRHAKAAWPQVEDRLRPLADRGRRDAPAVGRWLRETALRLDGFTLDRVVCSPARRTRETWELVAGELDAPPQPVYDGRVYAATAATLLTVLRETPPRVRGLVLVGHNPGMQSLAVALAHEDSGEPLERILDKYPTSGVALFRVEGAWSRLLPGNALLTEFAVPRGAAGEHEE